MGIIKKIGIFIAVVILTGFGSFFTCISMIDASFLSHLWLPFLAVHCMMALMIKCIHSRADKKKDQKTRSGLFLSTVFIVGITGYSIIFTSIIISLCVDPYCKEMRSSATDPLIIYAVIAILEYFTLCTLFDLCVIKFPGTRNLFYRLAVSFPAMLHMTTVVLSSFFLWLYPITAYFAAEYHSQYATFAPIFLYVCIYLFSMNGLYNSLFTHWSYIYIDMKSNNGVAVHDDNNLLLDDNRHSNAVRCDTKQYKMSKMHSYKMNDNDSLRICQIADPHIGPVMSVNRLRGICEDIIEKEPDLILLTGDYFTGEANLDGLLLKALEPLKAINYKCFACLGNHDMENDIVYNRTINELGMLGIKLLRNESVIYDKLSNIGPIQIIGFDFLFSSNRRERYRNILNENKCPAQCSNKRIVLLHDPANFNCFEGDENIVVFSGHTHGGHVGILSCGLQWTLYHQFVKKADNGLWQKGNNKLYIHRGQGSRALYGNYVLRCGVPTEQSVVHIQW